MVGSALAACASASAAYPSAIIVKWFHERIACMTAEKGMPHAPSTIICITSISKTPALVDLGCMQSRLTCGRLTDPVSKLAIGQSALFLSHIPNYVLIIIVAKTLSGFWKTGNSVHPTCICWCELSFFHPSDISADIYKSWLTQQLLKLKTSILKTSILRCKLNQNCYWL